jgi:cytochrome c oxidase subunit 2
VLLYLALRFRRRKGRRAEYIPANKLRTMAVVLVPCAVILGFDLLIDAVASPVWGDVKERLPAPDMLVRITGEQWAWRFTYPGADGALGTDDDFQTVNDLHVPVDNVVLFELTAKDVLHSLWIPELRLKQDAVPGRVIRGWFRPVAEGSYEVACAEICGFGHTMMKAIMTVESEDAYRQWLDSQIAAQAAQ